MRRKHFLKKIQTDASLKTLMYILFSKKGGQTCY